MKPLIVLASVGMLGSVASVEGQAPQSTAQTPKAVRPAGPVSLKPAKPQRVVNLKNGAFVIDEPGNWVLNRNWRFEDAGDIAPTIIDVVADDVALDFRGFELEVAGVGAPPAVTVIHVQGDRFTLTNAEAGICCEGGTLLHSTGNDTVIIGLRGGAEEPIRLEGDRAVVRDSVLHASVHLGSSSEIANTFIGCKAACVSLAGNQNKLLNSRLQPDDFLGVRVGGNGNVLAGNVIDVQPTGPEVSTGIDVDGDNNVVRNNTLAVAGLVGVAFDVSGAGNVLDGNIADRTDMAQSRISVGVRFEHDANYYGDNRMQATVPFDLGGTTQTDWDGNVGY